MAKKRRQYAPGTAERHAPEEESGGDSGGTGRPPSGADWAAIAARVEALLDAPVANLGCRLLEAIYRHEGRWVLRLVIDKPGAPGATPEEQAVTLDDCGAVSEVAGRILDVEDPIPNAFSLEVTSPGVFRLLKEPRHFAQSVGKVVRFTIAPGVLPGRKERTVRGTLKAADAAHVEMDLGEEQLSVPLDAVRSARLDPDL